MTGQSYDNKSWQRKNLVPYLVIICEANSEPIAMDKVIGHYNPYIAYLSKRNVRDEEGFFFRVPNPEIEARLTSRLICAVMRFKIISKSNQSK